MKAVALKLIINFIQFTFIRHTYKIEKITNSDEIYIQYFAIGTRLVWIDKVTKIIKTKNIINKFSPTDAWLIGYSSVKNRNK